MRAVGSALKTIFQMLNLGKSRLRLSFAKVKSESALILKSEWTTASERKVLAAGVITNISISSC
jgi:hypothetical protein